MADWTPEYLQNGLSLWLDADDSSSITIATGVSVWEDKSDNSNDATQGTASYQPTVTSAAINGKDAILFDGSNDYLAGSSALLSGNSPCTWFIVYKPLTVSTNDLNCLFGQKSADSNLTWRELSFRQSSSYTGDPYLIVYGDDYTDSTSPTISTKLAAFSYDGSAGILYRNGSSIATKTHTLNTANTPYLIGTQGSYNAYCYIAEIVCYNYALSTDLRQIIEGYLAWKWGVESSLPTNHPYYSEAPNTDAVGNSYHEVVISYGEAYIASIGYGDTYNYFESLSIGWIDQEVIGESLHSLFINEGYALLPSVVYGESFHYLSSTGLSPQPAYGYYDGEHYSFVCSGTFDVGNYSISKHYLSQSVGEGTSITVVYGNSVHKEIVTGETDIFRFALGNAYMLISTSYGRGWVVPQCIGDIAHEESLSSGTASTGNWGVVDVAHSLVICSGIAVGNPTGYGDTVHPLFKSFGISELDMDASTLAFSRCSTSVLPTVDPDPITALQYERCS